MFEKTFYMFSIISVSCMFVLKYSSNNCIWGHISGGLYPRAYIPGTYIWRNIPGAYNQWLYTGNLYLGAYTGANIRGLINGKLHLEDLYLVAYIPRTNIRGLISGGLISGAYISVYRFLKQLLTKSL